MKPRQAAAVIVLAVVAWVVASRFDRSPTQPTATPAPGPDPVGAVTDWFTGVIAPVKEWVGHVVANPTILLLACGVVVLVIIVRSVRARMPVVQDPQRMYSPEQRKESFRRAGGQCEYTGWLPWTRCRKPAEHADHLFPWSRGGATTLENCVASCARHNTSKGAKVLPAWQVRALVRRRRRYFPAGVDATVGQKYADVIAGTSPERAAAR